MTVLPELGMCGFELPLDELVPGFLVPIFLVAGDMAVQRIALDGICVGHQKVSVSEKYLAISTMHLLGDLSVELLWKEPLFIGNKALHAFFDGSRIYAGSQSQLIARLAPQIRQLAERLIDKPFTLASLCDFIGDTRMADRLRNEKSVSTVLKIAEAASKVIRKPGSRVISPTSPSPSIQMDPAIRVGLIHFCQMVSTRRKERYGQAQEH